MAKLNLHHLLLITAAAVALLHLPSVAPDISSDRSALLALRSAVGGRPLLWDASLATPCSWAGVTCSPEGAAVVALRLPGMGLSGRLPPGTIANLTNLRTLSLRFNALSGPLPADLFAALTSLRSLYLQHNSFAGQIPDSLFSLTSLVRVNLGHNNFSGPIPPSFNNLTHLSSLHLENNHFSGPISNLNLTLSQFNVSNNILTGQIPGGLSNNPRSSFAGNSLCGDPLDPCSTGNRNKSLSGGSIAGIVIGSVAGLLLLLLLITCLCKCLTEKEDEKSEETEKGFEIPATDPEKKKERVESDVNNSGKKDLVFLGNTGWDFDLEDLLKASAEVLGKGAFGTAYKAVLETGLTVAVKRLRDVVAEAREFREKMEEIGRLSHDNLVPLRAYYYNKDEKLLVYDYLPMGSLSALLHGNKEVGPTALNWETRASIALYTARGISYIHSQGPSFSHGNIKSSNILLTGSYKARVSDMGLGQIAGPHRASRYRAPEVVDPCRVSQKADVYSFGVLLLELLTGNDEVAELPRWVNSTAEVFDTELMRYRDDVAGEDMVQLLKLAIDCTAQHPDIRPEMNVVSGKIEEVCRWSLREEDDVIVGVDEEKGKGFGIGSSPI
ncbi:leucine-rich repeat protein kinase family protein [Striga asiatica]|uniref:Leucine-rich repeat protein kinase family protein n=1 Tax=Striga asiatica TaxID=4170 RepID=A0A5A7P384_STRAF|nr:leucine-rich repeat protein kinase family protein [Striga asiatica]